MTDHTCFTRPLALPDLAYALNGSRRDHPRQIVIEFIVEGDGVLSDDTLRNAVEKVAESTPACRMVLRGRWGFRHWQADGPLPRVKTVEYPWDGYRSDDLPFMKTPLDLFDGPGVEILQVISKKTYLIFRVHHALMDGVAVNEFMLNFFRALRNEPLQQFDSAIIDDAFRRKPEPRPEPIKYGPALSPLLETDPTLSMASEGQAWKRISFSGRSRMTLPEVMVILAAAARRHEGSGLVRFRVPVDLRRHRPDVKTSSNLIGIMLQDVTEQDDARSLVKKMNRQLAENRELPTPKPKWLRFLAQWTPMGLLYRLAQWIASRQQSAKNYCYSATLSSMNAASLGDYSGASFTATAQFGIPITPITSPIFLAICTSPLTTEITIGVNEKLIDQNGLDNLCTELKHHLTNHLQRSGRNAKKPKQPMIAEPQEAV